MPYIKQEQRQLLDVAINNLVMDVLANKLDCNKGVANYIFSTLTLNIMRPSNGWSYSSISDAIASLQDAADELKRRLMAKREDEAIATNGDLIEYVEKTA